MARPTDAAGTGWQAVRDEGIRLLEAREFAGAIERLAKAASGDPSGESEACSASPTFFPRATTKPPATTRRRCRLAATA